MQRKLGCSKTKGKFAVIGEGKRHRAAALQDAVATERTPLPPRGPGVRQPYPAFVACPRTQCSFIDFMALYGVQFSSRRRLRILKPARMTMLNSHSSFAIRISKSSPS